jgi:hypothetical protein
VLVDPTPISTDQEQFAALSQSQQAELLTLSTNHSGTNDEDQHVLVGRAFTPRDQPAD